jgi:HK97 family phage portal protein
MATVMDWNLTGNAYWIKIRDQGGRPAELWWTPSGLMRPVGDEKTFIQYYEYRPMGDAIEIDPDDVVHFRYNMDAQDPRKGRSPLSSLLQEVYTDQEGAKFTAALLGNMGVPGLIISPSNGGDDAPSTDDVKATKDYMREGFLGDRRGEPLVMSGPTNVAQFGFNPQQLTLRELRRIPEERVTGCLGIPAIVAGLGAGLDRSTFANFSEAREAAYQDNIIPSQRMLAEDIRFQLLVDFQPDDYRSYRFGFDLSSVRVLQEDMSNLTQRLTTGVTGGWVRVAEARRAIDLEVDPTDEVYLRNVSTIEIPAGEEAESAPVPPQVSPGQQPAQLGPPAEEGEDTGTSRRKRVVFSRMNTRLLVAFNRDLHVLGGVFHQELENTLRAYGVALAESYLHLRQVRYRRNGHSKQDPNLEQMVREIVAQQASSMSKAMQDSLVAQAMRVLQRTVDTINNVTNLEGGVSDLAQEAIFAEAGTRLGLLDIPGTTKTALFTVIDEGNQNGWDPIRIARSIREDVPAGPFVNAGPTYRAQLISRTETRWAQNASSIALYRENDSVQGCVAMDGTGDPDCASRDGQEYSFDDAEIEMNSEHPNGTLAFAPVIGTLEEALT